jgi:putative ABC transport system permease protein
MRTLLFDLRDALRGLRRDRLYAAAVVGTLALTLGATTAVFSIVNGVLLKPLAYRESQRLVSIREVIPRFADKYPTLPANARHFDYWRRQATSISAMAELDWRTTNLTGVGDPAQIVLLRSSGTLFDVLQAPVAMGRPLTWEDERDDRPAVTVISHSMWADRLGSDSAILGRALTMGGRQYTVVGVLLSGYQLPSLNTLGESGTLTSKVDAIIPFRIDFNHVDWMGQFNYPVVARLKPGVTVDQVRAEMNVLQGAVAQIASREEHEPVELRGWVSPLEESIVGRARVGLLLLLGAIGAVVLIACSNMANLSLTRTLGRMRDIAVRASLGASRERLVRLVVVEQVVLAAAGGALGLLVARVALELFVRTAPIDLPRVSDVVIDARVLAFAAVVAIAAGLAVAVLPAWRIARGDVQAILRAGGHGTTDRGGLRVRATLLAVQVALSVTLLVVTGLFTTSFLHLLRIDPGFSTQNVIVFEIAPVASRYPTMESRAKLYDRISERVQTLPGIISAAWTSALPLTGETWVDAVGRVDQLDPSIQRPSANYRFVGPDYFKTMSMSILKGRSIEDRDRTAAVVPAVISARVAGALWPGEQDVVGRQFTRANPNQRYQVVGVVVDGHPTALDSEAPLMVYLPYWANNEGKSALVVKTAGVVAPVVSQLRQAVRQVDPDIAIAETSPLQSLVDRAVEGRRYQMWLFVAFGCIALLIATVGIYATTAYAVSRRRREMNIRVALGARVSQVLALVLRQSTTPVAIGLLAGGAGALALGTVVASLLFEVRARDPLVIAGVLVLVGGVGLVAAAVAARHGLRLNPAAALRDE